MCHVGQDVVCGMWYTVQNVAYIGLQNSQQTRRKMFDSKTHPAIGPDLQYDREANDQILPAGKLIRRNDTEGRPK